MYMFGKTLGETQIMLDELVQCLKAIGIVLNPDKVLWMCNRHTTLGAVADKVLRIGNTVIRQVDEMTMLGSVICASGSERKAVEHRVLKA